MQTIIITAIICISCVVCVYILADAIVKKAAAMIVTKDAELQKHMEKLTKLP